MEKQATSSRFEKESPQGSLISPTLFLVFIDDITENLSTYISRALHADDLAIWTAAKTTASAGTRLQGALDSISLWASKWFVQINQKKTEATCFTLSTNNEEDFTLLLNGEKIKKQDTPKYLGVKLDKRLTWNAQISENETRYCNIINGSIIQNLEK